MLPIPVDHSTVYATKRGHLGFANRGITGDATYTVKSISNIGHPGTAAQVTADVTRATSILVAGSAVGRLAPVTAVTGLAISRADAIYV